MDKPKKKGRASKLTPETQARIVGALEAGCYFGAACQAAGIDESTGYRWMERGERGEAGYREFREAVKKAEGAAEAGAVAAIRSAYQGGTWQAAAWYLERKHPERWGKVERPKLEPADSDDGLKALMDALAASREASQYNILSMPQPGTSWGRGEGA